MDKPDPIDLDRANMLVEHPVSWTCYGFFQGCGCPTCTYVDQLQKALVAKEKRNLIDRRARHG